MNRVLRILVFGFLVWLTPFLVSLVIYPLRIPFYPLFESIMSVIVTISAVIFSYFYLKNIETSFIREGVIIGGIWFIISIIIDLFLFLPSSPMHMSLSNYIMGIGLKYLIIPTITIGFGYMIQNKIREKI